MASCGSRPQTTPPWGLSEPLHVSETDSSGRRRSTSRPATRTEMLDTRRQELRRSLAGERPDSGTKKSGDVTPWWGGEVDWWTLAEGYRENAMENMSSSPRFQRYMSKRDRARHAESPDPFSTHEVRIKGAPKPFAEKISAANPPPKTAEAYYAPKRTIKHFTDEINAWKARVKFQEYLDERVKSKVDESKSRYGSPSASFTGCNLNPKGRNNGSAYQGGIVPQAPPPVDRPRPTAAAVARRAINKRWIRGKALSMEPAAHDIHRQEHAGKHAGDGNDRPFSATCVCSPYLQDAGTWVEIQLRPPSPTPESNRHRYSRLCGHG